MKILARVKNKNSLYGYVIETNGNKDFILLTDMYLYTNFTNAVQLKNGIWKAKSGHNIKTIDLKDLGSFIQIRKTSLIGKPTLLVNSVYGKLSKKQEMLLDKCKYSGTNKEVYFNKKSDNLKITMKDLSCLTAYTNVEFSLFERTDSYYLIMGTHTGVHLTPNFISRLIGMKYKWIGHTHPGTTPLCLYPSPCVYEVLNTLNQESSAIYNSVGEYYVFDRKNGGF